VTKAGSDDDAGDYLPVSRLAVAALGLGILSALALVFPAAWPLPLVAAALAAAALADLGRPGVRKAGRWVALAGLALAVGFAAQAVTSALVSRAIARGRATAVAGAWLDAIRSGRLADALLMGPAEMLPPAASGDDAALDRLATFAALPAIRGVQDCGADAAVAITGVAAAGTGWTLRAELSPCAEPARGGFTLTIDVEPLPAGGPGGPGERWIVTRFAPPP
jgi:hypothetical protein